MLKYTLTPLFRRLDEIDKAPLSYSLDRPSALRQVFWTLAFVSLCLLLIHYAKYYRSLLTSLRWLAELQGYDSQYWVNHLRASNYHQLLGYVWWTSVHVIGYVVMPVLLIKFYFKASVWDFGWRFGETAKHWRAYLLLLSPILVFVFIAAQGKDFVNHYPFYKQAGRSWFDLLAWEALYLLQFLCLEFFFRGFMLRALQPALGANAIWVMCVPYLMIHFPKLWPEAFGAILFGLFLGILAMQSRSLWGGFFVHAGVAVSMDVLALIKKGYWPG